MAIPRPEPESKSRTVIEPLAEFTTSTSSSPSSLNSIRSLAISRVTGSKTLVYMGTVSGTLLSSSLDPNPIPNPNCTSSSSSKSNFSLHGRISVSGSSVNSIHVAGRTGKIVVLSDGFLYVVDSLLRDPAKRFGLVKGITVLTRRFTSKDYSGRDPFGTNGEKTSQADSYSRCFFAVAAGKKLIFLELVLGGSIVIMKEVQWGFDGIKTILWIDDSVIVGTHSGYYLYSCLNGRTGLIFSLPDSSDLPMLKLLVRECKVMLMVDNVGIIVNSEGQPVGGSLVFGGSPDSLGEIGSHLAVVRKGKIELYHKKIGHCVQNISFAGDGIGPVLVADEADEDGALLLVAAGSKVICYWKVPPETQIKDLLRKKNLKEAISLIEELDSEGEMSKETLSFIHAQVGFLLLFDLQFKDAVDHFLLSDTLQPPELFPFIMRDPNRWSLLVPRNRYWGLHPPPKPLENVVDDGLIAIQRAIFLKKAGVDAVVDESFLSNPPSRADLLDSAIRNMIRYLEACRYKSLDIQVKEGVDTLLMYLYRYLNCVDDMERLAASDNNCIVEELESLLSESGHLRTLAFLYATKGMCSKALSIWRILARNYSSSYLADSVGENGLDEYTNRNISSDQETAVMEASRILEESSDQDLILQNLGWIADINEMLAVRVLISEKRSNPLSPDEVVAAIDPRKAEVQMRYLQWLIEDQDSEDTRIHTTYALLLAKSALETYETELTSQTPKFRRQKDDLGRNLMFETHVRERLQIFLLSSDLYDPEEVLDMIEGSELWLEKAILYRKLGQEKLVLQILALKLGDYEAAEQYCEEVGRQDAYMQVLEMYLNPNEGKAPMFNAAVRLLHNRGESLDPLQVFERLSPDMPLQLVSDTVLKMLRARLHHHHQGQIVHNLSRALDVDASLARLEERSRHVLINDESVCGSCHARLGTKLFAMYPDDTIVCYKCFRRQGESTSVSGSNFKKDILYKPGWLVRR